MVDRYYGSYEAISIQSCETVSEKSSSSDSNRETVQITRDMVDHLHGNDFHLESGIQSNNSPLLNAPTPPVSEAGDIDFLVAQSAINYDVSDFARTNCKQHLMIVYDGGDINCALHFLIKSLINPFDCNAVATILIEECLREEFVQRLVAQMRPMNPFVTYHPKLRQTLTKLDQLKLETIKADFDYPDVSPILVCDCQPNQLGEGITGAICLNTFRSTLELVEICGNESMPYATTSIWNESIEELYQLVVSLNCSTFFFNCNHITLLPIAPSLASKKNDACVHEGFHYESLEINDQMKCIVFPIGAHLAQKSNEQHVAIDPISYLNE